MAKQPTTRQIVKIMAMSFIMANNLSRFDRTRKPARSRSNKKSIAREQPRM